MTVSVAVLASGLPSFAFVWPSNCGSRSFTERMAIKPFAHVVAGQIFLLFLQITLGPGVIVQANA